MTDKEVLIIDGVIKGILAFLSNPKNEGYLNAYIMIHRADNPNRYIWLWSIMGAEKWLKMRSFYNVGARNWQQCVDHALMILQKEYDYEQS